MSKPLLTPAEAAQRLGVSDQTIRNWAEKRKVRHVRLPNGQVRFHPEDIDALLTPVEPVEATA